jgi:hypothetical protein
MSLSLSTRSTPLDLRPAFIAFIVWTALPSLVTAQTYSSDWKTHQSQAPASALPDRSPALETLLKDLDRLVNAAARQRAADPGFINDLRDLSRRYSWPWSQKIAQDSFSDGDHTQNPAWIVARGRLSVGPRGLILTPERGAAASGPSQTARRTEPEDIGRALLGGILRELAKDQQGDRSSPAPAPRTTAPSQPARAVLRRTIPNSFALRLVLDAPDSRNGVFEFGVGQGESVPGYFLIFRPGSTPTLSLERRGSRGSAVIETAAVPERTTGMATKTLQLTRDSAGALEATVDGVSVFRVTDRAFRSAFDRFVMTASGTPFTVRTVSIYGAP